MATTFQLNPERVAYFEAAGWRAYYDHKWIKVLRLIVGLCQEQFRISFPISFLAGYYTTCASAAWVPVDQDERIHDYLLDLFLRQLEKSERDELIFCAVPRFLDVRILRAILQLRKDIEAQERWERYARFTFTTVVEHDRLVLHPLVRTMLLRHIPPDDQPGNDYNQVHQSLRTYFQQRITEQRKQGSASWQAELEDAKQELEGMG